MIRIKDFKKLIVLLFLGLLTSMVIYPFLHEIGHSIATILLGGRVVEFNLFPFPNVLCKFDSVSQYDLLIIGLSGMIFPIVVATIFCKKYFCAWYITRLILGISLLAIGISLVALIMNHYGITIQNEDILTATKSGLTSTAIAVSTLLVMAAISVIGIVKTKPLKRLIQYFE